jgi:hypothetical protein
LHASPSVHDVPFATTELTQLPPLHTSAVHGLPSLQSPFVTHGWQPGIGLFVQPVTLLQPSTVQALPSSQLSGVPAAQLPL